MNNQLCMHSGCKKKAKHLKLVRDLKIGFCKKHRW